jgi:hypothetical protein
LWIDFSTKKVKCPEFNPDFAGVLHNEDIVDIVQPRAFEADKN